MSILSFLQSLVVCECSREIESNIDRVVNGHCVIELSSTGAEHRSKQIALLVTNAWKSFHDV